MDPKTFLLTEWDFLKKSAVVRGLLTMEALALGLFIQQVISGQVSLTVGSLKDWGLVQAGLILAFLFRHAWAGIEVQLAGKIPPEIVKGIEQAAQERALAVVASKAPTVAETARVELSKKEVTQ